MRRFALLTFIACALSCGNGARKSDFVLNGEVPNGGDAFRLALYQTAAVQFTEGNQVEWIDNGAVFERIREDIRAAKSSVNIVLFIWRPGPPGDGIADELAARAKAGVTCRVIADPVGSTDFEEKVKPKLTAAGCEVRTFRPIPADENLARNHRKLVIVDGRVGYTGGFGFYESWLGDARNEKEWRDVAVRVRGPVVAQMQQAIAENWQEAGGALLPASDFVAMNEGGLPGGVPAAFVTSSANPELTRAERVIQLLSKAAKSRLWIAQAYFTPTEPLMDVFENKAKAGVDVRVLAPGDRNDQKEITHYQRKTYKELTAAGVKLWEFPVSMMHSKTILVDDRLVFVGSINFDPLSYRWLEEGSLLVDDPGFAQTAAKVFEKDLGASVPVKGEKAAN